MTPTGEAAAKPSKFRNVIVWEDGEKFDSKKELRRWKTLKARLLAGEISDLRRQVSFGFDVNGEALRYPSMRPVRYIADFTYIEDGRLHVEDTKSKPTRREPVYRLKLALLFACHPGVRFVES